MPRRRTRRSEGRAVPRDAPCRGAHTFGEETVGWCRRRVTVMVVYHRARHADGVLRVVPRVYGFGARLRVLPFPPPARTLFSAPRVLLPPWTRRPAFFSHTLTRSLTRSFRRRERLRPRQSRQARFRRVDARGDFPSFSPSTSSRLRPRRPFPPFLVHQHSLAVPLRRRRGELRFESRDAFLRLSSRRGGRLQGRRLGFPRASGRLKRRRLGFPRATLRLRDAMFRLRDATVGVRDATVGVHGRPSSKPRGRRGYRARRRRRRRGRPRPRDDPLIRDDPRPERPPRAGAGALGAGPVFVARRAPPRDGREVAARPRASRLARRTPPRARTARRTRSGRGRDGRGEIRRRGDASSAAGGTRAGVSHRRIRGVSHRLLRDRHRLLCARFRGGDARASASAAAAAATATFVASRSRISRSAPSRTALSAATSCELRRRSRWSASRVSASRRSASETRRSSSTRWARARSRSAAASRRVASDASADDLTRSTASETDSKPRVRRASVAARMRASSAA